MFFRTHAGAGFFRSFLLLGVCPLFVLDALHRMPVVLACESLVIGGPLCSSTFIVLTPIPRVLN